MMTVQRYSAAQAGEWNAFVRESRQGTFLLDRGYMDYHSDRFHDHSLMIYSEGKLLALLPANEVSEENDGHNEADGQNSEKVLYSHQGLTYGGLLTTTKGCAAEVCEAFRAINAYLRDHHFSRVVYKAVPWIYHRQPAQEDLYALFSVCHAQIVERNLSTTIMLRHPLKWRRDRHYKANKARTAGIRVEEIADLSLFWPILEENLLVSHHAKPVHTLQEMQLLQQRFPKEIRLFVARQEEEVLGGILVYVTPQVVHTQYISASARGKQLHAVDAIVRHLVSEAFKDYEYFDFGTSNEDHGRYLNMGLIFQKEGFGARGVVYDIYEWRV